jgi:pilus assembly protein CpaF
MNPVSFATPPAPAADIRNPQYQELKSRIHQELLNRLNLERLGKIGRDDAEPEIRGMILSLLDRESATTPLSLFERESMIADVLNELFGLGPLELLLRDRDISDILVNRHDQIYIERNGRLEETPLVFKDDRHLLRIIERIVSSVGRRVDESSPMVDARLADGSRVNIVFPPLALQGPCLSIRKFAKRKLDFAQMVRNGSVSLAMAKVLEIAARARLNVIVSGGTGSGKTTMLNALSRLIDPSERIVTVEDAAEPQLQQPHAVSLETRPPNLEGRGEVT